MANIGVGTFVEDQDEKTGDPFDLFSSPNVVTDLIHGKTVTCYPRGPLTDTGPYEFIINGDSDFIDLPFTRLNGEIQITKADGTAVTDTELNAFVNLLPQSTNEGKLPFSMILHVDFLNCHRPLIPHVDVKLKFIRSDDSFSLLGATKAVKIKINDLSLDVRKITFDPQLADAIENKLSSTPAVYPVTSGKIQSHIITSGRQTERVSQIFRGKLPRQIIIGFVDSGGYDGNINKNPFKFGNFGINSFQGYINGEPITPQPFKPKFDANSYMREYRWFLDNLGCYESKNPLDVTYEEFKTNSCFFVYDMSPELCNLFHQHGHQSGIFDFDVGFEAALTKNVTAIIYGSFHEVIMVDKSRNITVVE